MGHEKLLVAGLPARLSRQLAIAVAAAAAVLILSTGGAAPAVADSTTCPPGRIGVPSAGVTATYNGTWTYEYDQPEPLGSPDIVQKETLNWSESLNGGTSGCWTLNSIGGSASETGAGTSATGGGNCEASISERSDAATNFVYDQTNSAGIAAYLELQDPGTGVTDNQHWYVQENAPNYYDEPEGLIQTNDSLPNDFCYEPNNGNQPVNDTRFSGGGCHIGNYYAGGPADYLTFLTHGGGSGSDNCTFTIMDAQNDVTTETLTGSITMTSTIPVCSDLSASTSAGKSVSIPLSCSNSASSQPLHYLVKTQPQSGFATGQQDTTVATAIYSPKSGFTGRDTFTYAASLENGLGSDPATVTVTVTKKPKKPKQPKQPKKPPKPKKTPTGCQTGASHAIASKFAHAHSATLPSGYCSYLWLAGVDGTSSSAAISKISWTQSLAVTGAPLKARAISFGHGSTDSASFSSAASSYALGGVAVRGYKLTGSHKADGHAAAHHGKGHALAPSAKLSFTTTPGQLVVVLVAGQGTSSIAISGLPARKLGDRAASSKGGHVSVAGYAASPAKGTHTVLVKAKVPATNSGTSDGIVVFVFTPR